MIVREIVLDTETTGLSPRDGHRIVEIGALEMENKVLTGNKFHFSINSLTYPSLNFISHTTTF